MPSLLPDSVRPHAMLKHTLETIVIAAGFDLVDS